MVLLLRCAFTGTPASASPVVDTTLPLNSVVSCAVEICAGADAAAATISAEKAGAIRFIEIAMSQVPSRFCLDDNTPDIARETGPFEKVYPRGGRRATRWPGRAGP